MYCITSALCWYFVLLDNQNTKFYKVLSQKIYSSPAKEKFKDCNALFVLKSICCCCQALVYFVVDKEANFVTRHF
jgi:hypothetical protein